MLRHSVSATIAAAALAAGLIMNGGPATADPLPASLQNGLTEALITAAAEPGGEPDSGTLLVRFRRGVSRSAADSIAAAQGSRILREITGTGFAEISTGRRPAHEVRRNLAASADVDEVEANRIRRAAALPNDLYYLPFQAPYLELANLSGSWDITTGRDDLVVAVLDTGVDLDHPDLAARLVAGTDLVNRDSIPDDDNGHGTMVAGIVGARTGNASGVAGVTWRGGIMPVKVLGADGSGTDADIAAGIVWAVDHGASVINLSLGAPGPSKVLEAAVDHANARNSVVVAAAGNSATSEPIWPAAAAGVVAVGATDLTNTLASFSNFGSWVDLVAPGVSIASTAKGGRYGTGSGTSLSAPIVSGVALLARAHDPQATAVQITDRLLRGAQDLGVAGVDLTFGAGLVDALATLRLTPAPLTTPVAPPAPTPVPAPAPAPVPVPSGYWMVGSDGRVYPFGDARGLGDPSAAITAAGVPAADLEPSPSAGGYWILDERGAVFGYGDARHLGGLSSTSLTRGETATSISATSTGRGYWIFTTGGRVFAFGDAAFHGDLRAMTLNGPVLDSVATPTGHGYYIVASDGGIFAFGDARFYGSMGNRSLNAPVQSLVPDPDGAGYWLVASDGGVFAFDAGFRGSTGDTTLNAPITGMVAYGNGYLMVATDGGVFNFSDKTFSGSLGANPPPNPIVAVAVL